MKEDLALYGNELDYANTVWSAAYVFGQVRSDFLLTRVSFQDPSAGDLCCILTGTQINAPLYIAFIELSWTVFTFTTAAVKDVNHLCLPLLVSLTPPRSPTIINLVIALACLKPDTFQPSCTCARATTKLTSWRAAIP
jgi:hypothetical protein